MTNFKVIYIIKEVVTREEIATKLEEITTADNKILKSVEKE